MKYIILVFALFFSVESISQSPAEQVASKVADKLKDSLNLSSEQRSQLYDANLSMSNQKMALRSQYNQPDSLRFYFQKIENTRDSLYRPILGEEKFLLYKEKKGNLINIH